jgi:hypothetical protein
MPTKLDIIFISILVDGRIMVTDMDKWFAVCSKTTKNQQKLTINSSMYSHKPWQAFSRTNINISI